MRRVGPDRQAMRDVDATMTREKVSGVQRAVIHTRTFIPQRASTSSEDLGELRTLPSYTLEQSPDWRLSPVCFN
jgi:hypothetical protein